MRKRIKRLASQCKVFLVIFILGSCYRHHLYVQQEWVDRNFLASSHVHTPDPRQEHPPEGQRLLIAWRFPHSLFCKELTFNITVRFWDDTEKNFSEPIRKKRGCHVLSFPGQKILTYRIQVFSKDNELIETWTHHFWTKWIDAG
jgi:hypothetical protein